MRSNSTTHFDHVGAMPAPTWYFLSMNDTTIALPENLEYRPSLKLESDDDKEEQNSTDSKAFEHALDKAQSEYAKGAAQKRNSKEQASRTDSDDPDATYGGLAYSNYQANAEKIEAEASLKTSFEQGLGKEMASFLETAAKKPTVIETRAGQTKRVQLSLSAQKGAINAAAIDIITAPESVLELSILLDDDEALAKTSTHDGILAVTGTRINICAGKNSHIRLSRTQVIKAQVIDIDTTGITADKGALIEINHTLLGGEKSYTGLACDLRGDGSALKLLTHYLGQNSQERDFNYVVRHHGKKTESDLQANGVLTGSSSKTLRGTIDLIRGAREAQGSENETVLLVDKNVHNKTVPTILCNEDDVAGNHGATIGHIREEQLFYLASRGLSQKQAEKMCAHALIDQALFNAPTDEASASILAFKQNAFMRK